MTRTALVTGGNRGIGRETCRQLSAHGLHVILSARDEDDARAAALALSPDGASVETLALDVTSPEGIATATGELRRRAARLDILVNNAGISMNGFDAEVARKTLDINFFGPLRVTEALLPLFADGGTIVMVSSGMGELAGLEPALRARLTDPTMTRADLAELMGGFVGDVAAGRHRERGWPSSAYRVSKAGLNALVRVWAPELAERRITINAVCPGWVRTRMGGEAATRSVEQGAASIVWAALREGGTTGGFFRDGHSIEW